MIIERTRSHFILLTCILGLLHISSLIHDMLPELPDNQRKDAIDLVIPGINLQTLSPEQLHAFSTAYGIAPVALIAKAAEPAKTEELSAMSPRLIALVTTLQQSKGKILLTRNGKPEFADVQLGDKLFGFTVTEIDDSHVKLVNGEQQLRLEVFTKPKADTGQ